MDKSVDLSKWPDSLVDAIVRFVGLARPGDVVIIKADKKWTQAQRVAYAERLQRMQIALSLRFSFMIVHGEEVEISHAAKDKAAPIRQDEAGEGRSDEARRPQPG